MHRLTMFIAAGVFSLSGAATASSFIGTTDAIGSSLANTVEATSDISSSVGDDKVVLEAREDAASFVGSDGDVRGVRLEAALTHIRSALPELEATDMQLAAAILAL